MKGLKKLALATAVAAAPFAQAELTAMDDALLEDMTGQAGITIDVDLDMTIDAIKYVDQDGDQDGSGVQGAITMKGLTMNGDGSTARIRGITIDVDGTDGLVMGLNQIGDNLGNGIDISIDSVMINAGNANLAMFEAGVSKAPVVAATTTFATSGDVQTDLATFFADPAKADWTALTEEEQASFKLAVGAGTYTPNANTQTLLNDMDNATLAYAGAAIAVGAGDGNVGGFVIEDFRNYIQDDLVNKYNGVFNMALQDSEGVATGTVGAGDNNGRFVRGEISINGTGNAIQGTGGLRIAGQFGGAMDKLAWVDGYGADTDATADGLADAAEFGVKDMGFFHGVDTDGDGISDTIEGMHFSVDIDVEDRQSWNHVDNVVGGEGVAGTNNVAALKISNMSFEGTIMMGEIYLGSSTDTVNDRSLGSVLIKDIDMTGTSVYIYGH